MKRFQFDAIWQRDFYRVAQLRAEQREHVAAGYQLRHAGADDEARAELALAEEDQEQIELLEHALREL